MAFNSLNTIDKDCVTIASRGRKMSVWCSSGFPKERGKKKKKTTKLQKYRLIGMHQPAHTRGWKELHKPYHLELLCWGFFCPWMLPVSTCTSCFSIFGYECWDYHLHLGGENCVLCFSGILFWGTLVLSINQENILVVFLLLNFQQSL